MKRDECSDGPRGDAGATQAQGSDATPAPGDGAHSGTHGAALRPALAKAQPKGAGAFGMLLAAAV